MVLLFIRAPFYVLLVFIAMCADTKDSTLCAVFGVLLVLVQLSVLAK